MAKRVVIIGGGVGGISTAYNLRKLDANLDIKVVSGRPYFGFTPAFPHLAIGWRKFGDISTPLQPVLKRKNIDFINEDAEKIDPDANKVTLKSGKVLEYDYLVIATGPKLVFTDGQEENGYSVCTVDHALHLNKALEKFFEKPGPVVVGAKPGTSCFGPGYEFAFMLNYEAKKRGVRHKFPIHYITSEPFVGHLGLGGVGSSKRVMEDLMAERDIRPVVNVKTKKVEKDHIVYEDLNGKEYQVESAFTMLMPSFMGTDVVASAGDKVANPANKMVIVDKCFNNPTYKNIYGVGVVAAMPPVEQTPVPTGTPKTGQMIEGMALATALNIISDIRNSSEKYMPTLAAICIADMGDDAAGFIAYPVIPPRAWTKQNRSKWMHWVKSGFEKYFLWKVKIGDVEPWFEKMGLEAMFNLHLVEPCADCSGLPGKQ